MPAPRRLAEAIGSLTSLRGCPRADAGVHFICNGPAHVAEDEAEMVAVALRTIFAQTDLDPVSEESQVDYSR